mgnify:CR=1 FL=1
MTFLVSFDVRFQPPTGVERRRGPENVHFFDFMVHFLDLRRRPCEKRWASGRTFP